jgi:RimJ/RimL family protein N-acetyltransferase
MVTLETERLKLRMFREDDFEEYARITGDEQVTRYLSDGRPLERWEAWRQMAMILGHWQLRGYGPWAVEEKSSGRLLGRIGFFNPEGWPGFELGWVLSQESWGKGFATEGARRALDYAFSEMGRDHIISVIHPDNSASIRVAQRIGEKLERRAEFFGHEVLIYGAERP